MGFDSISPIVRSKSTVDTRVLKSKIGHAILKGGSFHSKTLSKTLRQLTQDAKTEVRIINHQMRIIFEKNQRNMKRSEKLVATYNLPPLKSGSAKKSSEKFKQQTPPDISITGQSIQGIQSKENKHNKSNQEHPEIGTTAVKENKFKHLSPRQDSKLLRRTFYSPVPTNHQSDLDENSIEDELKDINISSSAFPHITVDQCEELFPPLKKDQVQKPEYALSESQSRTGSTNSLGVPSPLIKRRETDGKVLNIVIPSDTIGECNFSRSEGSIPDALKQQRGKDDPRFKALEAVLKPATTKRAQTRTPTKDLEQTKEEARRTVSRSVSPKPRFANIKQPKATNYNYNLGPRTPP